MLAPPLAPRFGVAMCSENVFTYFPNERRRGDIASFHSAPPFARKTIELIFLRFITPNFPLSLAASTREFKSLQPR